MKTPDQVIKSLRLTEKSNQLSSNFGQYTFEVYPDANRHSIREAVERAFKVTVTRVNVMNIKPKRKRNLRTGRVGKKSAYKKAIVTLKEGDQIEIV
ncbi:MAG TPA: 50S ribosomal protein L23 [Opitutales bacterium]|nr:50S ribosomal protein L23 [Opitutales bacterium]